ESQNRSRSDDATIGTGGLAHHGAAAGERAARRARVLPRGHAGERAELAAVSALNMRSEGTMRETIQIVALGLTLLASTSPSLAAEEQTPEPATHWHFDVMPYAWIPGTFGSVEVKGRTATIDTTIGDVLTLLWHGDAFTIGGYFAARYDR